MAQLINEAKRMQHLAGIKSTSQTIVKYTLLEAFVKRYCLENKILLETLDEKVENKIQNAINNLDNKGTKAINTIAYALEQLPAEGQKLYLDAVKAIAQAGLSTDDVAMTLSNKNLKKEANNDEEFDPENDDPEYVASYMKSKGYTDKEIQKHLKHIKKVKENPEPFQIIQRLGDWIKNTKLGKAIAATTTLGIFAAAVIAPTAMNLLSSPVTIEKAAQETTIDSYAPSETGTASDVGAQVLGKSLSSIDSEPNTSVHFIQFDYGKGKTLNSTGEKNIDDIVNSIKDIKKSYPDSEIDIDVTGLVSKTTGNVKKMTDTKEDGDVARGKIVQQKINDKIEQSGLKGVKVNTKPNSPDAYKSQKQVKPGEKGGAGAVVVIKGKNLQDKTETPPPYIEDFKYNYAELGGSTNIQTEPRTGEPSPSGTGSETLPKTEPSPSTPSSPQDIKATATEFSKLNRNGQIATVLSKINPGLDISKKLGQGKITSYTDANLTATQGDAKKLAALIMNIRKNPDALLKKVANATGIKLEPRAKAVTTKVTKGTQAQLQAIKESSLISLLREAMIDQISDEDIKKNQDMILALLGTMYASAGNTELSIVPKDSAQAQKLKDMGFAPQPGGNYVFLAPGQTKAQVQNFDTQADKIKTQPDITRVDKKSGAATTYKTALSRIKTPNDFADLIVKLIPLTNTQFQQDTTKVNSAFSSLRNRIKIQESVADVDMVVDIIKKDSIFSGLLSNVNTAEEFVQLILRDIVPDLPPALKQGENIKKVKSAIITAANNYKKQSTTTQSPQNSEPAPAQHSSAYNKQQREKQAAAASKK